MNALVIGSGIAGLSLALRLADHGHVTILTKRESNESNTYYAQGGIASVVDEIDSYESHIKDTIKAGAGLCRKDIVRMVVENGPAAIDELLNWGVEFSHADDGDLDLGREGGHSFDRIIHARDATGREIENRLLNSVRYHPNIQLLDNQMVIDLITEHHINHHYSDSMHCYGAYSMDRQSRQIRTFAADVTILATGGSGYVYRHTTNPDIATGDGIAMAYRAGCEIENLEFMQFHPTSLYNPAQGKHERSFLISEAVRGIGGILKTPDGTPFMGNYHRLRELAPRDIVARAIDHEMKKHGYDHVKLDLTHIDRDQIISHFPTIYRHCLDVNIDISREMIPVVPAAHYMCGGVKVDTHGETRIRHLYACGETASTGLHGANRLASNSLLEALVYSKRVYQHILKTAPKSLPGPLPEWDDSGTINTEEWGLIRADQLTVRQLMWDYVGIVRSNFRLKRALNRVDLIRSEIDAFYKRSKIFDELVELRNLVTVAQLIIRSALQRKESRGLHYTTDYPAKSAAEKHDTVLRSSRFPR